MRDPRHLTLRCVAVSLDSGSEKPHKARAFVFDDDADQGFQGSGSLPSPYLSPYVDDDYYYDDYYSFTF